MGVQKRREGLGLYRQEVIKHDRLTTLFLLEYWLVANGTIKISIGIIKSERNGEYNITPRIYRDFIIEEHEDYKDLYVHAMNYRNKLKNDWQYMNEQLIENQGTDTESRSVEIQEKQAHVNIVNAQNPEPSFKSSEVAVGLIKQGTDFDTAVKVKNLIDEQISNNINNAF